jgi:hypothetical protein
MFQVQGVEEGGGGVGITVFDCAEHSLNPLHRPVRKRGGKAQSSVDCPFLGMRNDDLILYAPLRSKEEWHLCKNMGLNRHACVEFRNFSDPGPQRAPVAQRNGLSIFATSPEAWPCLCVHGFATEPYPLTQTIKDGLVSAPGLTRMK